MKILVISSKYPPEYAGSAWRAHNTYKRLRAKFGIEYDVVCNSAEHNDNTTYEYDGVCVRRLCSKWGQIKGSGVISKIMNHFLYLINFIYVGFLTWRILNAGNYVDSERPLYANLMNMLDELNITYINISKELAMIANNKSISLESLFEGHHSKLANSIIAQIIYSRIFEEQEHATNFE